MQSLTIALAKGRIFDETLPLLARGGHRAGRGPETSRKLIIGTNRPGVRFIIVRASDVPTYVQYGARGPGRRGQGRAARARRRRALPAARPRHRAAAAWWSRRSADSTARGACSAARASASRPSTSRTAREHFAAKAMHVDLIKLYGSMELAPLVGLADAIVDLVSHRQHAARPTISSRSRRSCRSARARSSIRPR